ADADRLRRRVHVTLTVPLTGRHRDRAGRRFRCRRRGGVAVELRSRRGVRVRRSGRRAVGLVSCLVLGTAAALSGTAHAVAHGPGTATAGAVPATTAVISAAPLPSVYRPSTTYT